MLRNSDFNIVCYTYVQNPFGLIGHYVNVPTHFHEIPAFAGILLYTLISTSTPLGNSSFIKASIVLDEEL